MSDTTTKVNASSVREIDPEDKIAALKERLAQDHTGLLVNGTNGSNNHGEKSKVTMNKSANKGTPKIANGVNNDGDNGDSSRSLEGSPKNPSTLQVHSNGKFAKSLVPVKNRPKSSEIEGKLPLPAGMSVTSVGKHIIISRKNVSF